jgi:hypothetical protein
MRWYCALAVLSLYHHCTLTVLSLYSHSTLTLLALYSHATRTLLSLQEYATVLTGLAKSAQSVVYITSFFFGVGNLHWCTGTGCSRLTLHTAYLTPFFTPYCIYKRVVVQAYGMSMRYAVWSEYSENYLGLSVLTPYCISHTHTIRLHHHPLLLRSCDICLHRYHVPRHTRSNSLRHAVLVIPESVQRDDVRVDGE